MSIATSLDEWIEVKTETLMVPRALVRATLDGLFTAGELAISEAAPEPWHYDDRALLSEAERARVAADQARGRWLALIAEVDKREASIRVAGTPTATWLAGGTSHSARAARSDVRLAVLLDAHPRVAAGLRGGVLSSEQAGVLVQGLGLLPDDLTSEQTDAVAAQLVDFGGEFNPAALRQLVNRAVEVVAPDIADDANKRALERAEAAQHTTRHIGWRRDADDGGLVFWGKLPAVAGELFTQHLTALAVSQRAADALNGVDTSQAQALADALAVTVRHHASCEGGPVQGGDHTRVVVTIDHARLMTGLGAALLVESGTRISAGEARRLACTSGILPIVLGGGSQPMDLGRSRRLFTPAQRLMLAVRDGGCAFPACDRVPSDCEAHHRRPWEAGGQTNVDEGVLLCPHHHHLVEPDPRKPEALNWLIEFDERSRPRFAAPTRQGGGRIWKQHHRYRI